MRTCKEIRQQFIDFFVEKCGHTFVPSSPVVPHDDPTLLFTNAGMNQFKDVFLGAGKRDYTRAVNTQKCIRAGGKHNDLEDVGRDTYHHTFFEMLGNWSFGDYFKKESIAWAWDLLTNVWGLDKSRLHATVFGGDPADGLAPDDEAVRLWKTLTDIHPDHVHLGSKKDNFWEMGDTGPCGPCSEIHIDLTPDKSGSKLVNAGDARVMEIWNLVFIQFNRNPGKDGQPGPLQPLPAKHVDTGMGLERVCAVLQGKQSNYDIDLFTSIFNAIRDVTHARAYTGKLDDPTDIAYRVIADHIRCLTFALTDGAAPSNEGRGYVLRRILRRAVRHGWQTLGMKQPFLHRLVAPVVETMSDAFPELAKDPARVAGVIHDEERSFARAIDLGIALFEEAAAKGGDQIAAEDAFKLHDTHGFPLDLTQVMAQERGLTVDVSGFNRLMKEAQEKSRPQGQEHGAVNTLVDLVHSEKLPPTTFLGYDHAQHDLGKVAGVFQVVDGSYRPVQKVGPGAPVAPGVHVALVVDQTPFYAEAGGQVGDIGVIESSNGTAVEVTNTIKFAEVYFHLGTVQKGALDASSRAAATTWLGRVDPERRVKIMANHTSTHLMNLALRNVLGDHVQQKGSLVDDAKLRFDFSHNHPVAPEEIDRIEQNVNTAVAADLPVYAQEADQQEAMKIRGLRAVFGEKYPPRVRVVSIGVPLSDLLANPDNPRWMDVSVEFCGGTHLKKTGDAEGFVITDEEAVAKGVRRVTALTGSAAHRATAQGELLSARLDALKSDAAEDLSAQLAQLNESISTQVLPLLTKTKLRHGLLELQKAAKEQQKQKSKESAGQAVEQARQLAAQCDGQQVIVASIDDCDAASLRTAMDVIRKKRPDAALLLGSVSAGKVSFLAAVPPDLIQKGLKAGDWVRQVASVAGGGGGGKPDMAQAGGKDPAKLPDALDAGRQFAKEKLS